MRDTAIAIPAYNEDRYIGNLLDSLRNQESRDYFVVVCDNGSRDQTRDVILRFKKKYPTIAIELTSIGPRGVRYARKHALDVAQSLGAKYLLTTDADSRVPQDFVTYGRSILKSSSNTVLYGRLVYPPKFYLIAYLYMKPILQVSQQLIRLHKRLFGPAGYGGYFGLPSVLYRKLFVSDLHDPLIIDDDLYFARRCYYHGGTFAESTNEVHTSDRRFWHDAYLWMSHARPAEASYAKRRFTPPSREQLQSARDRRIQKFVDRSVRYIVDGLYMHTLFGKKLPRPMQSVRRAIQFFDLPRSVTQRVPFEMRHEIVSQLHRAYRRKIQRRVEKHIALYA